MIHNWWFLILWVLFVGVVSFTVGSTMAGRPPSQWRRRK